MKNMNTAEILQSHKDTNIGPFYFDPTTLLCIISQIQLASRHPKNTGPSREIVEQVTRKFQQTITELIPELNTIIEMGWNPDFDF